MGGWLGGPGACTLAKLNWKWLSPLGVWVVRCVGGEVSTSYKSSNRIEISQSVQDLFHFQRFELTLLSQLVRELFNF